MFKNKYRSFIILILTVILALPFFTAPVSAAYENTYKNTGNQRNDIIGVALTQVGYKEGKNNYTKYGVWYGRPNSPWCGMFVSWCAKEAGIPTSVLKRNGVANPKSFGLSAKDGKNYTPQKGDLFFKKSGSHVGLVYYTEGDYFYTIEGNTYANGATIDGVMIRKRKISDFYFASPNYSGSSNSNKTNSTSKTATNASTKCTHTYKTKAESTHPHKEYKICTKCSKKTYTGNNKSLDTCKTCVQAACKHTFDSWKKASDSKHTRTCTKCGIKETGTHNWELGKVLKKATCVSDGKQQKICKDCNAETTKTLKATGTHKYGALTYVNESTHKKVCSVCSKEVTAKHKISSKWQYDGIYHWTTCSDCNSRLKVGEHAHPDGCTAPCKTCGYVDKDGHNFTGNRGYDDTSHWELCDNCGVHENIAEHKYTSDCDEICSTCGYQRSVTVAHKDTYHADDTGHWQRCSACERITEITSHRADDANDWENQLCIDCGYILRTDERHVHGFEHVEYDESMHWGTCACGEEMPPEVHSWDFQTGLCSICGINTSTTEDASGNFLVVLINRIFDN